jgi:hypothetical protein
VSHENPNPAAFFFDDGAFLNLECVESVGRDEDDSGRIEIHTANSYICRKCSRRDFERLRDALAVYHSKA